MSKNDAAKPFLARIKEISDSLQIMEQAISITEHPKQQNQIYSRAKELKIEFNANDAVYDVYGETLSSSGGTVATKPIIVIQNNTGYTITDIRIKASESTSWGNNLYGYSNLYDGESRTFTLSKPLSEQSVYDIKLETSSGGYIFVKHNFYVSDGAIIIFNGSDLQ